MAELSAKPWPPPPDLESLKELFATADVEDFIADGAPTDEYDPEADHFFKQIKSFTTKEFKTSILLPLLETLWVKQFAVSEEQLAQRRPALLGLAEQIERFFGPEARPQVR